MENKQIKRRGQIILVMDGTITKDYDSEMREEANLRRLEGQYEGLEHVTKVAYLETIHKTKEQIMEIKESNDIIIGSLRTDTRKILNGLGIKYTVAFRSSAQAEEWLENNKHTITAIYCTNARTESWKDFVKEISVFTDDEKVALLVFPRLG